jgi:hypothetical protein
MVTGLQLIQREYTTLGISGVGMRQHIVLLAAFALAGCGQTAAQVESGRIRGIFASEGGQTKACTEGVNENPAYAPIALHLPYGHPDRPSLEQLTDSGVPSVPDVMLIKAHYAEMEHCRALFLHTLQQTVPAGVPIAEDMFYQGDKLILKLVRRQISWGTFNEISQQIVMSHKADLQGAASQVDAQLEASHQAEMAQRVAVTAAILNVASEAASDAIDASYDRPVKAGWKH